MCAYRLTRLTAATAVLFTLFNIHVKTVSVLCISDLGHLELEVAGSSCCTQDAAISHPVDPLFAASDGDCGSCVDVFFRHDIARIMNRIQVVPNNHAPISPFPNAIFLSSAVAGDQGLQKTIPLRDLTCNPVAPGLFSTVIRC
jgi:hypothetical protein